MGDEIRASPYSTHPVRTKRLRSRSGGFFYGNFSKIRLPLIDKIG